MSFSDQTTQNELDWQAFRYVSGELSNDEAAAFELRLATDTLACEAVARVTQLGCAIAWACDQEQALAAKTPQPQERSIVTVRESRAVDSRSRWASALLTGVAASAVAAAALVMSLNPGFSSNNKLAKRNGAERLVAAWAHGEAVRNAFDDDEETASWQESDLEPPDWLLAAVSVEQQAQPVEDHNAVREN